LRVVAVAPPEAVVVVVLYSTHLSQFRLEQDRL
jgi:hypothetical protein